jgi:hypothetical protein
VGADGDDDDVDVAPVEAHAASKHSAAVRWPLTPTLSPLR